MAVNRGKLKGYAQAITGNRLIDGVVVYRTADGAWSPTFGDATVFAVGTDADGALAEAKDDIARRLVVGVYLFEVDQREGGLEPVRVREVIRAKGPSIRTDLGKQASAATAPAFAHAAL